MLTKKGIAVILTFILSMSPVMALADGEEEPVTFNWVEGPTTIDLGEGLATLKISDSLVFLDKEDTIKYNELIGNIASDLELGMVLPIDENEDWFVIFEYEEVGHVEDDEKEDIDGDAILKNYQEGTEEANKLREENGFAPIYVIDWEEAPHYDEKTHNLVWSMMLESEGDRFVNYNTRLLGREGYVSATLAVDDTDMDEVRPQLEEILSNFSYKEGQRYEDYNPATDKLAEYGLTALIAGGAGAAAAKAGFFAKILLIFKKFFIIIIAVVAGFVKLFWKRIRGEA